MHSLRSVNVYICVYALSMYTYVYALSMYTSVYLIITGFYVITTRLEIAAILPTLIPLINGHKIRICGNSYEYDAARLVVIGKTC